jgi:hypothetical protein
MKARQAGSSPAESGWKPNFQWRGRMDLCADRLVGDTWQFMGGLTFQRFFSELMF